MTKYVNDNFYQLRSMIDSSDVLSDTIKINMCDCLNAIEQEFEKVDRNLTSAYNKQSMLKDLLEHLIDNL